MSTDDFLRRLSDGTVDERHQALAEFIEFRRPALLAYVQRQLSDALRRKIEPEDVLQDAAAAAAEALRSPSAVDFSAWEPFGWLCQLCERRIIDAHRRFFGAQKRDASREVSIHAPGGSGEGTRPGIVDLLVASLTTPSQAVIRDERKTKMLDALHTLPQEQQDALIMRYFEGLPSKEIAAKLHKTDGAVRVMLTRSLQKLQALLGEETASS